MTGTLLLTGLLLAQSAGVSGSEAVVTADNPLTVRSPISRHGWLTTSGPDSDGRYTIVVSIADLSPATDPGQRAMTARIRRATAVLCDISAEQPQIPGFYNPGLRNCMKSTEAQASAQLARARDAARRGQSVSVLSFTTKLASTES